MPAAEGKAGAPPPGEGAARAWEAFDWLAIAVAAAAVAFCYAAYLYSADALIHSDSATELLAGREMYRQKTIFLAGYYHSTEIFLVRLPMFAALWMPAAGSLLGAFRLAVATDVLIQSLCFVYMARRLGAGPKAAALGLLAYFGARTYGSGESVGLCGSSYGTMCSALFLAAGYYAAARLGTANRLDRAVGVAVPVLAFLFGVSSLRLLATLFAPLILVHAASKLWSRLPQGWAGDRILAELLLWAALSAAGWAFAQKVILPEGFGPKLYQTVAANGLGYAATESLPALLLDLVEKSPAARAAGSFGALSLPGLAGLMSAAFLCACAWGAAGAAGRWVPTRGAVFGLLLLSLAAAALPVLLLVYSMFVESRYLFSVYALVALGAAAAYGDAAGGRPALARAFLAFSCAFLAVNCVQNVREIPAAAAANPSRVALRHTAEIEEALASRGVSAAYSLYWQSAVTTVVTDGRAEVWGVWGDLTPYRSLVPYGAFAPGRAGERSAFVRVELTAAPGRSHVPLFAVADGGLLGGATERVVIPDPEADVVMYFFDRNPFVFPPGHDPAGDYSPPELLR